MENSLPLVPSIYSSGALEGIVLEERPEGRHFLESAVWFGNRILWPFDQRRVMHFANLQLCDAKESVFPSQGLSISSVSSRHRSKRKVEARDATGCAARLPLMTKYRDIILRKAMFKELLNHAVKNNGIWMPHVYGNGVFFLFTIIIWYRTQGLWKYMLRITVSHVGKS